MTRPAYLEWDDIQPGPAKEPHSIRIHFGLTPEGWRDSVFQVEMEDAEMAASAIEALRDYVKIMTVDATEPGVVAMLSLICEVTFP